MEEIAHMFGIHKNTVRSWINLGLAAIDNRRPILILGRELSRFHCNRLIYRRVNLTKIDAVRGDLEITFTRR
jgi:hypothetical protein